MTEPNFTKTIERTIAKPEIISGFFYPMDQNIFLAKARKPLTSTGFWTCSRLKGVSNFVVILHFS